MKTQYCDNTLTYLNNILDDLAKVRKTVNVSLLTSITSIKKPLKFLLPRSKLFKSIRVSSQLKNPLKVET